MKLKNLVLKNRSVRRFEQDQNITLETLRDLIALARLAPTAANRQPLKYILSNNPGKNAAIFNCLAWAGYLKDWSGPQEGERPAAYIIICGDSRITTTFGCDHGIAAQTIMLGAVEKGYAGCMIGSIQKDRLRRELNIPEELEILLILALGVPKETVVIDRLNNSGSIEYWRDERQIHHVPKRDLDDLILKL